MDDKMRRMFKYSDEILEIIDNQCSDDGNDMTRSDLQGAVEALVRKIMEGK